MDAELAIKQDLAYAYRILAYLNLDDHTYTHLSSRSLDGKSFYIYPFGLRFEEVEYGNLIKSSIYGKIVEDSEGKYNKTGYMIHGSVYQNRPDINTVFHLHTPYITSVSAMKCGLLPISQWALHFYDRISYYNYDSLVLDDKQGDVIVNALGHNNVMLMHNHGCLISGRTIYEAMFYSYHLEQACKTQIIAMSSGAELIMPTDEVCKKSANDLLTFEENLGIRDWNAWVRLIDSLKVYSPREDS